MLDPGPTVFIFVLRSQIVYNEDSNAGENSSLLFDLDAAVLCSLRHTVSRHMWRDIEVFF